MSIESGNAAGVISPAAFFLFIRDRNQFIGAFQLTVLLDSVAMNRTPTIVCPLISFISPLTGTLLPSTSAFVPVGFISMLRLADLRQIRSKENRACRHGFHLDYWIT
nr:hypothetical protein [Paenibacillus montanisoli]